MPSVMCIRLECIWGLHDKDHDRPSIMPVVQHIVWQVFLTLDARGLLYVESVLM
jgi:hypothetical protein